VAAHVTTDNIAKVDGRTAAKGNWDARVNFGTSLRRARMRGAIKRRDVASSLRDVRFTEGWRDGRS